MTKTGAINQEGALPEGWSWARLGDAIREAQGGFACGERDPSGVIQLRMNNVTSWGTFDWSSFIRVPADSSTVAANQLQPGDVLFNNTNSTELVGKTALFKSYTEAVVFSNHFTRLRTIHDKLSPHYLALWLQSQWQQRVFENICNRWIGQSAVQRDKLLALEIPLPPLPEQRRIVSILSEQMAAVEQARAAAEARLEAAKALPAAYLRAIFDGPEAQQWPRKRLGDLALLVQNGIYKSAEKYGHGHPFVRMYNVRNDSWHLSLDTMAHVELEADEAQTFGLRSGDLLVSRVNSFELVGKCAWVGPEAEGYVFENMLIRLRLGNSIDSLFAAQQMTTRVVREQIEKVAKRAIGQASVNSKDVRDIQIALPLLSVQRRIAAQFSEQMDNVERARKALQEEMDTINKLPAALLRRAFNGEL